MGLADLKHISVIETVSAKTSVTINSNPGTVWKCKVTDLQYKVLPSPDGGSRFHGLALLMDDSGNIGAFLMCGANPTNSGGGGFAAEEVWLDSLSSSFLNTEFGSSQAGKFTEITSPAAGHKIAFMSITGSSPQNAWNITGASFSGGCAEATTRDHRLDFIEEIMKLKAMLDAVNAPSLSSLLLNDYSILSASLLSWSSGLVVNVSSGSGMFRGVNFNHAGGSISGLAEKTLYRAIVTQAGAYQAQAENSAEGTLDSVYNPSGSSPIPSANTQPWTQTGTFSTQTVANGVLTLAVSAASAFYSRVNVVNAPVNGSFQEYLIQWVSGTGFEIDIDTGSGNNRASVKVENGYIELGSNGQRFDCNTAAGIVLRLVNKNGSSRLYVNGQLVASSSSLLASSGTNRFRFGYPASSTGSVRIALINSKNLGLNEIGAPAFSSLSGAVLGSIVTFTAAFGTPVALQGSSIDLNLDNRREGRLSLDSDLVKINTKIALIETVGTVKMWPASTPPTGWLVRNGAAISRTTYSALFAVIGTTYGSGDGSNTFNLPDDRSNFERGWDNGRGIDSGRVFGSEQADDFKAHTHGLLGYQTTGGGGLPQFSAGAVNSFTATTSPAGGTETRPRNRAYLPIIKF